MNLVLRFGLALLLCASAGCGARPVAPATDREFPRATVESPRLRVLGTAQDGGLPHAGCRCVRCQAAASDPARRRRVASLALLLPSTPRPFLFDATPDLREQLDELRDLAGGPAAGMERAPLAGVFLTHAHIGHYTGLAFFGFEAIHTNRLPVHCSASMAAFLRESGPWSQLVRIENVSLSELTPGTPVELGDEVSVTAFEVPHRHEYTDTLAFVIRGPRTSVLYVPDCDPWPAWAEPPDRLVESVDVALLDGTFYSGAELPGRDLSKIGHPPITTSMDRFAPLVESGRLRVYFTHLNHSNPALDPRSPEHAEIERRGFHVLAEGQELPL